MLSKITAELLTGRGLTEEQLKLTKIMIFRCALRLESSRKLRRLAMQQGFIADLTAFKKDYIDGTYYVLSSFWRAVYSIYCLGSSLEDLVVKYNVALEDLTYAVTVITPKDIELIKSRKDRIPRADIDLGKLLLEIKAYIRTAVRRKLTFIFKYNNMDPEDLEGEILMSVTGNLIANDYFDESKLKAIARTTIKHQVGNLIAKYTTKRRSRLISTKDGYKSIVLSLDYLDEEKGYNLYNTIQAGSMQETDKLLILLKSKVTSEENLFLDLHLGNRSEDFLKYSISLTREKKSFDELKPKVADKAILSYLGWNTSRYKKFRTKIKDIITRI